MACLSSSETTHVFRGLKKKKKNYEKRDCGDNLGCIFDIAYKIVQTTLILWVRVEMSLGTFEGSF